MSTATTTGLQTAEQLVVAAALVDAHARQQVLDQIHPEDVAEQPVRRILETMSVITLEGLEPDMVLVGEYLKRDGDWLAIQKLIEIGELPKQTPQSVTQTQLYIDMVLDDARTRRAVKAAQGIIDRVKVDPSIDVEAELAKALAPVTSGVASHKRMAGWNSDTIPEFRQWVEDTWNEVAEPDYVPSGFKGLDTMLRGGFHKGNLITVGARPGMGKTAFGISLAMNAVRAGYRTAFFSAEMTTREVLRRASAEYTGLTTVLIDKRGPAGHDSLEVRRQQYLEKLANEFITLPLYVDDMTSPTVDYMTERVKKLGDIDFVIFDYIHLAGDRGPGNGESQEARISEISRKLALMAKSLEVPVVALAQLSRAVEQRQSEEFVPSLSDLRDSGMVEANSHVVLLLYRRRYYVELGRLQDDGNSDRMRVIVAKNRDGSTGSTELNFDPSTNKLSDRG